MKFVEAINNLIDVASRESVFALEKLNIDNPLLKSYIGLFANNFHPNDIQAILNKHKKEHYEIIGSLPDKEIEARMIEVSPLAYSLYKIQRSEFVKTISIAINIAETFLQDYAPEVDINSFEVKHNFELKLLYKIDLIGLYYHSSRILYKAEDEQLVSKEDVESKIIGQELRFYQDDISINQSDNKDVKAMKYGHLIRRMMQDRSH